MYAYQYSYIICGRAMCLALNMYNDSQSSDCRIANDKAETEGFSDNNIVCSKQ